MNFSHLMCCLPISSQTKLFVLHQVCYCMNIQSAVPIFLFFFPGSSVISVNYSSQGLQSCDHEEADTRITLHLYDAVNQGATNILVRTVDTDVIVILVGLFFDIHSPINIWVAFGTGKNFRYYQYLPSIGGREVKGNTFLSCFLWVRHHITVSWKGKKICVGSLEIISTSNRGICTYFA